MRISNYLFFGLICGAMGCGSDTASSPAQTFPSASRMTPDAMLPPPFAIPMADPANQPMNMSGDTTSTGDSPSGSDMTAVGGMSTSGQPEPGEPYAPCQNPNESATLATVLPRPTVKKCVLPSVSSTPIVPRVGLSRNRQYTAGHSIYLCRRAQGPMSEL